MQVQWERATANNALKFKESVESGQFIPEEIRKKLEQKVNRTPQEEEILQKYKAFKSEGDELMGKYCLNDFNWPSEEQKERFDE